MSNNPVRTAPLITALLLVLLSTAVFAQQIRWEPYGQIYGGSVPSMTMDAEGNIYAGTFGHGVVHSTDQGNHWTPATDGLAALSILDIHAFPTGGHVLAGNYQTVFLSTDSGVTWDSVAPGGGFGALAIDEKRGLAYINLVTGTYRSTNQGEHWEQVSDAIPVGAVRASLVDTATGNLFVAGSQSILRSEDSGATWTVVASSVEGFTNGIILSMVHTPGGSIFASGLNVPPYRSTDGGNTWHIVSKGLVLEDMAWRVASAPDGRLIAVKDTGNVYFSTNNGDTWKASGYTMGKNLRSLLFLSNIEVLAGFDLYGIERSTDGGQTFAGVTQGVPLDTIGKIFIGIDPYNRPYAGNGWALYRADGGESIWRSLPIPKTALSSAPFGFGDNGWIVAGVSQSTDDGESWYINYGGIDFYAGFPSDAVRIPTGQMVLTTSNGMYFITQGLSGWAGHRLNGASLLAVANGPGGTLFAGGILYLMARSTDNGLTWVEAHNGLSANQTNDIVADRFGNMYAATTQGLYRSTDTGESWSRVDFGRDSAVSFTALVSNPRGPIIAATGVLNTAGTEPSRIYSSDDGGITWVEQSVGLKGTVTTLALDSTGRVYAGASGGRIFRTEGTTTTLSVAEDHDKLQKRNALSITPNPSHSDHVRIVVQGITSATASIRVMVYDLLGQLLQERTETARNAGGSATVDLATQPLPNGSYQIVVDDGVQRRATRLMIQR